MTKNLVFPLPLPPITTTFLFLAYFGCFGRLFMVSRSVCVKMTELYFPEKGVRFIAVNDSVDSLVESSNDFNPNATGTPHRQATINRQS